MAEWPRRLRGRRKGRKLRAGRAALLETVLPGMTLNLPALEQTGDWRAQFPETVTELWLEIGFGGGEHLAWQAEHAPQAGLIGCEPFINGVATLLANLPEALRSHVRLHGEDGLPVLKALPDASVQRCFILFPDPWPKQRHSDRRFIGQDSVPELVRVLAPGAELRFGSDDPGMIDWGLMNLRADPALIWQARDQADWAIRPEDWPPTRYEKKALAAGRKPAYLRFTRRA